jgi:hypothetical protein
MTKSLTYGTFRTKVPTARRILLFIYLTLHLFTPFYAGAVISQDMSAEGTGMCHHSHNELFMHGQFKIST